MGSALRRVSAHADRQRLVVRELPADALTPVQAAARLRAAGRRVALLESAGGPEAPARFSFVCFDSDLSVVADGRSTRIVSRGDEVVRREPLLEVLRDVARSRCLPPAANELPPFLGGLVGYLAFEFASALEPKYVAPECDPLGAPVAVFEAPRSVLAFDQLTQRCHLATRCEDGAPALGAAHERIESVLHDLFDRPPAALSGRFSCDQLVATRSAEHYLEAVERARAAIRGGDAFQVVLARTFTARFEGDLFALHRALRVENGAPHMFFFESEHATLVGSSPERLVEVRGGRVGSVPIAGTRRRGADESTDRALEAELLASTKERCEHDMLVDLARHDLGRVARVGSVVVTEHARVLRLPKVMHLVSRVEADLASGRDAFDALAATFPAGTVSGAPKVRALQLVAELEGERRGPYGGAFGWIDGRGNLDMALVIRTFAARGSRLVLQAGAGVVHASVAEHELQEVDNKLAGPRAALERAGLAPTSPRVAKEVPS